MQPNLIGAVDDINDSPVVVFIGNEIKTARVEQQDSHIALLLVEEIQIALLDVGQITIADFLLVAASTLVDVALQTRHVSIEIHQKLRLGHIGKNDVEETRKQLIFVLLQVVARED